MFSLPQVEELDLNKNKATELLKAHDGDATKAIKAFISVFTSVTYLQLDAVDPDPTDKARVEVCGPQVTDIVGTSRFLFRTLLLLKIRGFSSMESSSTGSVIIIIIIIAIAAVMVITVQCRLLIPEIDLCAWSRINLFVQQRGAGRYDDCNGKGDVFAASCWASPSNGQGEEQTRPELYRRSADFLPLSWPVFQCPKDFD